MKKTLLLSVVASTMIMAGGDIAPVEPVVEAPVVAEASGWDFSGQAVVYYQTTDAYGNGSLFEQESSKAAAGIQLGAVNKDLFAGIGTGFELSGLSSVGLEQDVVSGMVQTADGDLTGAEITQAYLTYGIANTSIKIGRQQLPKSLSPFAFSEGWNVFKNTFEAGLVVNTDLPDTTLVYAYVTRANQSLGALDDWRRINDNGGEVHMITAQNKSIENLTLTGSYYLAPDFTDLDDVSVLWGDAKFGLGNYGVAIQGGTVLAEDALGVGSQDTTAFGAKVSGNFGMFNASLAYSSVDDGSVPIHNLGTGVKTPLYTQAILNQNTIKLDSDTIKVAVGAKALGGKVTAVYINSDLGDAALPSVLGQGVGGAGTYQEFELIYKTKVGENTTLFAAYINQNDDRQVDDTQNFIRFWARYNFN